MFMDESHTLFKHFVIIISYTDYTTIKQLNNIK